MEESTFNPSYSSHVVTGDDAFYGDHVQDNSSPLTALFNFLSGNTQQQQMLANQQEFQEYMYNKYNSPEALVRQFNEAGVNTNLIGSTSFGTANGSTSAPSANSPAAAIGELANGAIGAANAITGGIESLASAKDLQSHIGVNISQSGVNDELARVYGSEYKLNGIQYDTMKQQYDWSLQDREVNAMTLRIGYFQAVQNYRNSFQEFENLVKEGKILDNEIERSNWAAKIEKETYDILLKHGYFPDYDFMSKIFQDYVQNGDSRSFDRWIKGYQVYTDMQNRSNARFGAYGQTFKFGPVEIPMEYFLQSGVDLVEFVKEYIASGEEPTWIERKLGIFRGKLSEEEKQAKKEEKQAEKEEKQSQRAETKSWRKAFRQSKNAVYYSCKEKWQIDPYIQSEYDSFYDYLDECAYEYMKEHYK